MCTVYLKRRGKNAHLKQYVASIISECLRPLGLLVVKLVHYYQQHNQSLEIDMCPSLHKAVHVYAH